MEQFKEQKLNNWMLKLLNFLDIKIVYERRRQPKITHDMRFLSFEESALLNERMKADENILFKYKSLQIHYLNITHHPLLHSYHRTKLLLTPPHRAHNSNQAYLMLAKQLNEHLINANLAKNSQSSVCQKYRQSIIQVTNKNLAITYSYLEPKDQFGGKYLVAHCFKQFNGNLTLGFEAEHSMPGYVYGHTEFTQIAKKISSAKPNISIIGLYRKEGNQNNFNLLFRLGSEGLQVNCRKQINHNSKLGFSVEILNSKRNANSTTTATTTIGIESYLSEKANSFFNVIHLGCDTNYNFMTVFERKLTAMFYACSIILSALFNPIRAKFCVGCYIVLNGNDNQNKLLEKLSTYS